MAADFTDQQIGTAASQSGGYDQDGNGIAFDDFYGTLSDSLAFNDTIMSHIHGQPIGTMGDITGQNLHIVNSTFSGLEAGEHAVFGEPGKITRCSNLTFEDAHGTVTFHGIGDNINVASGNMTIELARGSQLNNLVMNEDSNVILRTANGTLNRVDFNGVDIDYRSSFSGAIIRGGEIKDCNFHGVDCSRADISDVHIGGGQIAGNFNAAMLRNMSIATDIRHMEVSESTTFHNVMVFDPSLQKYCRVDNLDQFQSIQRSFDLMDQARQAGATLNNALQQTQNVEEPKAGVEFQQARELVSNPAALASPSAPLEVTPAPAGGDVPVNDNVAPARNSTTPEYTGGIRVEGNATDAQLGSFNAPSFDTPEGRAAAYKLAAERTAAAMDLG